MKSLFESERLNSYISILINISQFYKNDDDSYDDINDVAINDSVEYRNFKKECKRIFGKNSLKEYGGGILELIITEAEFGKFEILANEYNIEFEIDDIVEY